LESLIGIFLYTGVPECYLTVKICIVSYYSTVQLEAVILLVGYHGMTLFTEVKEKGQGSVITLLTIQIFAVW